MKFKLKITILSAAAAAAFAATGSRVAAAGPSPVVAVLSSDTGPYQEALAGLRQELGGSVPAVSHSDGDRTLRSAQIIVAFGSRAALERYPDQAKIIYVMAPGIGARRADALEIHMEPNVRALLTSIRSLQPKLRRLGVLWSSERLKSYMHLLEKEAASQGITLAASRISDTSDIPDQLRALHGTVDALWLPPDPLLLNSSTLPVLVEYSRANSVPLYVPTGGLVEHGATAAFGPSFRELGRLAGAAAQRALAGDPGTGAIYAAELDGFISRGAAARAGINLGARPQRAGERLLP